MAQKTPFGMRKQKKVKSPTGRASKPRAEMAAFDRGSAKGGPRPPTPKKKKAERSPAHLLGEGGARKVAEAVRKRKRRIESASNTRRGR